MDRAEKYLLGGGAAVLVLAGVLAASYALGAPFTMDTMPSIEEMIAMLPTLDDPAVVHVPGR